MEDHDEKGLRMNAIELRKILAPVDFGEGSLAAARAAADLARTVGAELTLLHAYHPWGDYVDPPGYRERMRPMLFQRLEDFAAEVDSRGIELRTALEEGRPAKTITEFADRWAFDLVVMGAGQGRAPLLGSIAERVVRTSDVPVMVVPLVSEGGES